MSSMSVAMPAERQFLSVPAVGSVSPWRHLPLAVLLVGLYAAYLVPAFREFSGRDRVYMFYSQALFILCMWGVCAHGVWSARRNYHSLGNLMDRSERLFTAEARKVGEFSRTTQFWFLSCLFFAMVLIESSDLIALVTTRSHEHTLMMPFVMVPLFWLFAVPRQRGRLEVRSAGLVWYQLKTTDFIPWCAVREWKFRGNPRESVLTIQIQKKIGVLEIEKIGLPDLNETDALRVRELMREYCGEEQPDTKEGR